METLNMTVLLLIAVIQTLITLLDNMKLRPITYT